MILAGYPAEGVCDIHFYHSFEKESFALITWLDLHQSSKIVSVLDITNTVDVAPTRQIANASPESLAVAAETMLGYLLDKMKLQCSSIYRITVHKAWLQQTKPGKHLATGTPKLASAFHGRCLKARRQPVISDNVDDTDDENCPRLQLPDLIPRVRLLSLLTGGTWRRERELRLVHNLLNTLLWVLPKAGFSERICHYSRRMFPRKVYLHEPGLVGRVRRCLEKYTTRVQSTKLKELGYKIENGKHFSRLISVSYGG